MVSSMESIGRLITEEVRLQGERQLLRNRDQPAGQQAEQQQAPAPAAPISHNDKTVASVLLTLLDEQLDASAVDPSASGGNFLAGRSHPDATVPAASRIAAQYAEAEAVFRPDVPVEQPTLPPGVINQQALHIAASPELRMAMQSAFFSAAVRAQTEAAETSGRNTPRRKRESITDAASFMRIGGAVLVVIVVAIVVAAAFGK